MRLGGRSCCRGCSAYLAPGDSGFQLGCGNAHAQVLVASPHTLTRCDTHLVGDAHSFVPRPVSPRYPSRKAPVETQECCSQRQVSASCAFRPAHSDQPPDHFGSNLSGPFFLFRPDSALGQLVMRIARPVPYLNMGKTWLLSKKYEGTGPLTIVRENAIREVFLQTLLRPVRTLLPS